MLTKLDEIDVFFKLLGPVLYSEETARIVSSQWQQDLLRKDNPGKKKKFHCVHIETPRKRPLVFEVTELRKKRKVLPVLEGRQCFCAEEQRCKIPHHQQSQLLNGSIAICLYEVTEELLSGSIYVYDFIEQQKSPFRIHFDRRNEFEEKCICDFFLRDASPTKRQIQPGPIFHTQFGGKGSLDCSLDYRLDEPRIPSYPMDFILLADLALRNFYHRSKSANVLDKTAWKKLVKKSFMQLVIPWKNELDKSVKRLDSPTGKDDFFFS